MKDFLLIKSYFLLIFVPFVIFGQEQRVVSFEIEANNVPDSCEIYISGNRPELGNWLPDKISLINTSDNFWEKSLLFKAGDSIEYKITRGSWQTEAVNQKGDIPGNYKLTVKNDTIIIIKIDYWKDQFKYKLKGQVTGRVDYYRNLKGEGILPRDMLVWLPPDYENDTAAHYPVIYMQDAQNLFDPATSILGIDWGLDETADSMIKNGKLRSVIIVGLTNTEWRSSEYADNDTGYAYMKFIVNKIKPFIDSTYRTLKGSENTAVGGASLGALISFMLAWNYPDVFSKVICISPALKISSIDYVKNVREYNGHFKKLKFYFDVGGDSLDNRLKKGTIQMIDALKQKGYMMKKDIMWYVDKRGSHNEASWSKRIKRPLLFFFGK